MANASLRKEMSRESLRSPPRRLLQRRSLATSVGGVQEGNENGTEGDEGQFEDGDNDALSMLETNIIEKSRTIEDFTRLITEWRTEREKAGEGSSGVVWPSSSTASLRLRDRSSTDRLSTANLLAVDHASGSSGRKRSGADTDAISQYSYDQSSSGDVDENASAHSVAAQSTSAGMGMGSLSANSGKARCTCCCGKGPRKCRRARRAAREWQNMENDLELAAQIGQALLRRNDALQTEIESREEQQNNRLNSVMKRLSSSIKETSQLEKRLEQSDLNIEAADASHRAVVRELDEARRELQKSHLAQVRASNAETRAQRAEQQIQDLRQELAQERKQAEHNQAMFKRAEKVASDLGNELRLAKAHVTDTQRTDTDRAMRRSEIRKMVEENLSKRERGQDMNSSRKAQEDWIEELVAENDGLQASLTEMKKLIDERNEELTHLREELHHRDFVSDGAEALLTTTIREEATSGSLPREQRSALTPNALSHELDNSDGSQVISAELSEQDKSDIPGGGKKLSLHPKSTTRLDAILEPSQSELLNTVVLEQAREGRSQQIKRETRTAQLNALIDYVQRIFSRLVAADVETLAKRLQRQKLTGDVGHLARSTVNGIVREADGLREHFRRAMDSESKGRESDATSMNSSRNSAADSDSLVARKEFFALVKVFKEIFYEIARLRNAINEVSLHPHMAAKVLQEHLGVQANEDKSVGGWIGRLFSATGVPPGAAQTPAGPPASGATNALSKVAGLSAGSGGSVRGASSRKPNQGDRRLTAQLVAPSRAAAAVLPSAIAVEVKGRNATETLGGIDADTYGQSPQTGSFESGSAAPSPELGSGNRLPTLRQTTLRRKPSSSLSGLFMGANDLDSKALPINHRTASGTGYRNRLSRVVDDDEISVHHNGIMKSRTLRPRNLSDSSMHTTYLNDAEDGANVDTASVGGKVRAADWPSVGLPSSSAAAPAVSRVMTPRVSQMSTGSDERKTRNVEKGVYGVPSLFSGGVAKAFEYLSSGSTTVGLGEPPTEAHQDVAQPRRLETSASGLAPSSLLAAPRHPSLRSKSSQAKLSMAAASMDRGEQDADPHT